MKNKLAILSLFFITFTQAQQDLSLRRVMIEVEENNKREGQVLDRFTKGSPYLSNDFVPAVIDGATPASIRYNAYRDQMEFIQDGQFYFLMAKANETEVNFDIGNQKYLYLDYKDNGKDKIGYLKEIFADKIKLYKKETITFKAGKAAETSYDTKTNDTYHREKDTYFIKLEDRSIENFPKNKNKLTQQFPELKSQIDQYFKSNKVSFDDENKLLELVKFLNNNL